MYLYSVKVKPENIKIKEEYIADLQRFKDLFASKYGIRSIGILGSVARGEHRLDSDLHVFVEQEEADPFTMFDVQEDLQILCGCKVDLLCLRKGLRSLLLKRLETNGVYA